MSLRPFGHHGRINESSFDFFTNCSKKYKLLTNFEIIFTGKESKSMNWNFKKKISTKTLLFLEDKGNENFQLIFFLIWSPLVKRLLFWPPSMVYISVFITHILHITNHAVCAVLAHSVQPVLRISSHMLCILTSSWVLIKCVSSPALGCLCELHRYLITIPPCSLRLQWDNWLYSANETVKKVDTSMYIK